jgi:hypothetical protein
MRQLRAATPSLRSVADLPWRSTWSRIDRKIEWITSRFTADRSISGGDVTFIGSEMIGVGSGEERMKVGCVGTKVCTDGQMAVMQTIHRNSLSGAEREVY